MKKIDELKAAVAGLGTAIGKELEAISTKLSASGTSDADLDGAIAQINALKATVDAETAVLTAPEAEAPAADAAAV